MKTLRSMFLAGFLGAALSGIAFAADTAQPAGTQDPAPAATDQGKADNEAYLAALKKCDSLNADQRQKCVDAAKRKFGQM
ncbi:MAG: hypothetical protein U1F52_15090 [Burkholderiales bacterium]